MSAERIDCKMCGGTGVVTPKPKPSRFPVSKESVGRSVRCPKCKGTGEATR